MARPWFLRVLLNSSSFSAILRSISCFTCPSSSWARSTLFSSASRADSASSRAACSSLLALKSTALFVKLVDGAASISELVEEILDLVSEVLVLAADNVQLLVGLIQSGLQAESLGVEVAALRVAGVKLSHQVVSLGLPLPDHLVEVATTLLGNHGGCVGPLVLHGEILQLSVHPGPGLLRGSNFGVQALNDLLGLL